MELLIAAISIIVLCYIIGFIGNPFLFVVFLPFAALSLFFILFFQVYFLVRFLVWRIIPPAIKELYKNHKVKFRVIVFACYVLSVLGIVALNYYWFARVLHPINLLGDIGVLGFMAFFGRCLIIPNKKMLGIISLAVFILLNFLFTVLISTCNTRMEASPRSGLQSLPYLTWVPLEDTIQKSGVILYDKKLSFPGLNLYNSRDLTTAYLMDMSGNIVHSWTSSIGEHDGWHHVELLKNYDLLAIVKDKALVELNSSSKVKFNATGRFHHDVAIAENQDIYTLLRKDDLVFLCGLPLPILNECIVILSPEGKIKREIPLYNIIKKKFHFGLSAGVKEVLSIYRYILNVKNYKYIVSCRQGGHSIFGEDTPFDIFHANSIEIIDRNIAGLCKRGDLLISIRQLDLIAILDIEKGELIWKWGPGDLLRQHHPTLLDSGDILIFDNRSIAQRSYSRVVELNPLTRLIVWEYKSHPPERFFSFSRGGNQRLPNGNTLITNSDSGQVFEVTQDGEVVWEFYNPRIKKKSKERAAIYRMVRIVDPENYPRLKDLK